LVFGPFLIHGLHVQQSKQQQGWILPLALVILMLTMLTTVAMLQQSSYLLTAAGDSHQQRQAYLASLPRVYFQFDT
jgi:small neutral amino acid transporter SnatA (MarC family)